MTPSDSFQADASQLSAAGAAMRAVAADVGNFHANVSEAVQRHSPTELFGRVAGDHMMALYYSYVDEYHNLAAGRGIAHDIADSLHGSSAAYAAAQKAAIEQLERVEGRELPDGVVAGPEEPVDPAHGGPADPPSYSRIGEMGDEVCGILRDLRDSGERGRRLIDEETFDRYAGCLPLTDVLVDAEIERWRFLAERARETFEFKVPVIGRALAADGVWEGEAATAAGEAVARFGAAGRSFAARAEVRHATLRDVTLSLNDVHRDVLDVATRTAAALASDGPFFRDDYHLRQTTLDGVAHVEDALAAAFWDGWLPVGDGFAGRAAAPGYPRTA